MKSSFRPASSLCLVGFILVATAGYLGASETLPIPSRAEGGTKLPKRTLTLADRIDYQRAIEEVYWRHRIWNRPDPKPRLDDVLSNTQLQRKVADYLRNSKALETYWQQPLTAGQLQAEMERMAQHTGEPDVLRELFEALENDPFVIAECLARPALAEGLLASWYAYDQRFHGELRQRAEADLTAYRTVEQLRRTGGKCSEIEFVRCNNTYDEGDRGIDRSVRLNNREWAAYVKKLATMFGSAGNGISTNALIAQFKPGVFGPLQEDAERYYATAVANKEQDRVKLAVVEWRKEPLESWIARTENQMPTGLSMPGLDYTLPTITDRGNACLEGPWTATGTLNAPSERDIHTAVWTGSEMIIWSGFDESSGLLITGGRYNPSTDTWTATSITNAPAARRGHMAIWTGSEMIVWGGGNWDPINTGGRYNPTTDSWIATSTTNAPSARLGHTMVWTGSKMIVWGGTEINALANTGGKYDPNTDQWEAITTFGAPSRRVSHSAVWSGSEMIVWGGQGDDQENCYTGGKYDPNTNQWNGTQINLAPEGRSRHTALWTGNEMIVWGGFIWDTHGTLLNTGGRYNPIANSWTSTSIANCPKEREFHSAVWTGSEMIVWGGYDNHNFIGLNTGGRYDASSDTWRATSLTNAPVARYWHTAVWTGKEMIVWGGYDRGKVFNTGARYSPQLQIPMVQGAVSRRTHGTAGTFDINLPLTGTPGIECRTGGASNDRSIVVTFCDNVAVNGSPQAAVTLGTGMIGSDGNSNGGMVAVSGNTVTIPLTSVANAQIINVTLYGVNDGGAGNMNVVIPMGVLVGDTTANGMVNSSDIAQTKSKVGQALTVSNFREDVTTGGVINAADVSLVKASGHTALP